VAWDKPNAQVAQRGIMEEVARVIGVIQVGITMPLVKLSPVLVRNVFQDILPRLAWPNVHPVHRESIKRKMGRKLATIARLEHTITLPDRAQVVRATNAPLDISQSCQGRPPVSRVTLVSITLTRGRHHATAARGQRWQPQHPATDAKKDGTVQTPETARIVQRDSTPTEQDLRRVSNV
jgi:hypothetical protein